MRIHTSANETEVYAAARAARVDLVGFSRHGSRKRDHAFEVKLEGASKRRPNGGSSGAGSGYAATWDQWGIFLAHLFTVDPEMSSWAYSDADDFAAKTGDRFGAPEIEMSAEGYVSRFVAYTPEDMHGDHRFEYAGTPRRFECKKCTAVQQYA